MLSDDVRLWPPRLQLKWFAVLGLVCAGAALPLVPVTHGWSYPAAPFVAALLTGVTQARRSGPIVFCGFTLVSFVLIGVAMMIFLVLLLVIVGPGD